MRDPQLLGEKYLMFRKAGMSIDEVVQWPAFNFRSNETCIEKYGSANDVKPKFMEVQVK